MFEFKTPVHGDQTQPIEDFLCEYVRSNWTIAHDRLANTNHLCGYFDTEEQGRESYRELREAFSVLPEQPEVKELDDQEWQNAYKAYIDPWASRDLHWVPVWMREEYDVPADHTAIYLDAGMAFGTGSHETTRLMARRLLDYRDAVGAATFAEKAIVDAGCGSGILAISAARLGANHVYGFDRDPEAVKVSCENLEFNGLPAAAIEFLEAGIEEGLRGRHVDLMVANIQADVLQIYAEQLVASIQPGGVLAMSGILAVELDKVLARFNNVVRKLWDAPQPVSDSRQDGEWADLVFFR